MNQKYPEFATDAPALQYIAFMGKHGPFKSALMARWLAASKPKKNKKGIHCHNIPEVFEVHEVVGIHELHPSLASIGGHCC